MESKKQSETWRILKKISMVIRVLRGKNREISLKFGWPSRKKGGKLWSEQVALILTALNQWTYVTRYSSVFLERVPGRDTNSPRRQASVAQKTDEKRPSQGSCMLDPFKQINLWILNRIIDSTR